MKRIILFCIALLIPLFSFAANSPWLPPVGVLNLIAAPTQENARRFYFGTRREDLPRTINILNIWGAADYGISDDWAVDAITGYVSSTFSGGEKKVFTGRQDSALGFRYRVVDEFKHRKWPTITLRLAGILKGTYPLSNGFTGDLQSPGDRVNAVETDLILGRLITNGDISLALEGGYLFKGSPSPQEYFVNFTFAEGIGQHFNYNIQFRRQANTSGIDIGGPGFQGFGRDFQMTKEIKNYLSFGIGYTTTSNSYIAFDYSRVIGQGRNTKISTIYSAFFVIPIGQKPTAKQIDPAIEAQEATGPVGATTGI